MEVYTEAAAENQAAHCSENSGDIPPKRKVGIDERPNEHADDAQRLLARLREVGPAGITTGELIREGRYGLRPPNRIGDLRRQGHQIDTIREENGVFRFVLTRENPNPEPRRKREKPSSGDFFAGRRVTGLPPWDAEVCQ